MVYTNYHNDLYLLLTFLLYAHSAMRCVFCATGQMGFSRQLSSTEIFEQVQIFSSELRRKGQRLSNVVFMGMVLN